MTTGAPHAATKMETGQEAPPVPRGWQVVAGLEVLGAAAAVVADLLLPTLVLLAMAASSLTVRRRGPRTLGLRQPARRSVLVAHMLLFAISWTVLSVAVLIPLANHLSGQRQDMSVFIGLQGNVRQLALLLVLSWTLAAVGEEVAFRGYLLTRLTDVIGGQRGSVLVSMLVSSVLFGLLHTEQGAVGVLVSTVDGLAFATLRTRYGTVWASVLAHGFINTIGFVAFFFAGPIYGLW